MRPVLLTLQTWIWNVTLRRPASLVLSIICLAVIWFILLRLQQHVAPLPYEQDNIDWEAEYEKLRIDNLKEHASFYIGNKSAMKPVPLDWTAQDKCPACFGTDMCAAIERKEVVVEMPKMPTPANKKGVYLGKWLDIPVAVKRMSHYYPKEFKLFDEFICKNATGSEKCNVSAAVVSNQSYVQSSSVFSHESMIRLWRISYPQSDANALTYALCISPRFIKMFKGLYGYNKDENLTRDQRAMLFTSMAVQPESLMLKFFKGIQFQRVAPRVYGACGRLVIIEHGGRLLASYLDEPFHERAEYALQLLSMVQVFWHADRRWFALYKDFVYENIAVSHDNEIFIIDYEELSIIENTDFDEANDEDLHVEHYYGHNITCNDACFKKLFEKLANEHLSPHDRHEHCNSLHSVGGAMMYSILCRNILSDIPKHRHKADRGGVSYRGLLHSVPKHEDDKDIAEKINSALLECVEEKEPGGRVKAVNNLADLLALFMSMH